MSKFFQIFAVILTAIIMFSMWSTSHAAEMIDHPIVKLQSLDKTTARTMTFEANVGSTVKFGSLYIKVQACRKAPPIEQPESAAFLQVWEIDEQEEAEWVFSGWMFASSPGLSSMDHSVYDVWVLDCLQKKGTVSEEMKAEEEARGEGEQEESAVPAQPGMSKSEENAVEEDNGSDDEILIERLND